MRLSTNQIFSKGVDSILDSQERVTRAQDMITNQTRLLTPSDDPAATAQVLRLNEKIKLSEQYASNGTMLQNRLNSEEVAMNGLKTAMDRVKVLTIQAGSGSLSNSDRSGIGFELQTIRDEVYDLMNTKDSNGDYIFAGFQSKVKPFQFNQNTKTYDYNGDEGELKLQISSSVTLAANDSGKKLFENVDARLRTNSVTFGGALTGGSVTTEDQAAFDTFHKANYDATTAANNVYNVSFTAPNNYTVQNTGTGATLATGTYSATEGLEFNGLNIKPEGTAPYVGNVGFTLSPPGKKNILTTLNDLIDTINTSSSYTPALTESIKDTLVQTENAKNQVQVVQASLGGRLNVVERVMSANVETSNADQKTRSDLAEVDYAEAVTELMKQQTALEAAQQTFTKVSRLSLFDYL